MKPAPPVTRIRMSSDRQRRDRFRVRGVFRRLVRPVLTHEVDHLVIHVDRLAGVAPEAFDDVVLHQTAIHVGIVDVSNLELTATRWLEIAYSLEYARVVHVDANDRVRARRRFGLLANVRQPVVFAEYRHAEVPQMGWILHLLEQDSPALRLGREVLDVGRNALAEDVVAKHDDHFVTVHEAFTQAERFGDTPGLSLKRKLQAMQPELGAVAEQGQELTRVIAAGDDHNLDNARRDQRLDGIEDHWFV